MILDIILIVIGLVILVFGAEALVKGASSLAGKLRVSPLVIGLTVVAFGTSTPELTVGVTSAIEGSSDIALGNVIGSNIANILLILGVSALITPLVVKSSTVWKEIPFALLGVFLLVVMGNDYFFNGIGPDVLARTDGIVLLALMAIFMYYIFGIAKSDRENIKAVTNDDEIAIYSTTRSAMYVVVGLVGLIAGGRLLVDGAVSLASSAGLSESLIGLTVVGIGTSLPEMAASVVAARKGHADIAVGNIVGSNIFNIFWILGLSSTILPLSVTRNASIDILVAIGATLLLFVLLLNRHKKHMLTRANGVVFLVAYVVYIIYLVQRG
jgi:cation:H+ antiporter